MVADVNPGRVLVGVPLIKGDNVGGVYVASTNTLEDAGTGMAMYPSDVYLAMKQSMVPVDGI